MCPLIRYRISCKSGPQYARAAESSQARASAGGGQFEDPEAQLCEAQPGPREPSHLRMAQDDVTPRLMIDFVAELLIAITCNPWRKK